MDIKQCELHPQQVLSLICLNKYCDLPKLACQKCLLTLHKSHIKSCILLSELLKRQHCDEFLYNDQQEQEIIEFVNNQLVTPQKIKEICNQLQYSLKQNSKQVKIALLEQETKSKISNMKKQKTILKLFNNSYEFDGLRNSLQQFKQSKLTQDQLNSQIQIIIQERQELLNKQKNKQIGNSTYLLQDGVKEIILNQVSNQMQQIKNSIRIEDSISFVQSTLSQEEEANIEEIKKGKQFIFNDQDEVQLIYSSCTLTKGVHEFQITIEYVPEEKKTQDENSQGLDSIIQPNVVLSPYTSNFHPIGGHLNNSGLYANPDYQRLNRLYIGVVEDTAKDSISTYSIQYQTQQCCALDIIRAVQVGSFHFKQQAGEKVEPMQTVFQKTYKKGLVLTFKINLNENKLTLIDSENRTKYEGTLQGMYIENVKPYILAYKSSLKVSIS